MKENESVIRKGILTLSWSENTSGSEVTFLEQNCFIIILATEYAWLNMHNMVYGYSKILRKTFSKQLMAESCHCEQHTLHSEWNGVDRYSHCALTYGLSALLWIAVSILVVCWMHHYTFRVNSERARVVMFNTCYTHYVHTRMHIYMPVCTCVGFRIWAC